MKRITSKRLLAGILALACGAFAQQASAQTYSNGFYVAAFGGFNFAGDADFGGTITPPGGAQNVDVGFDDGFIVGAAAGKSWTTVPLGPFVPRTEIELSYRSNDADTVNFSGNGPAPEGNVSGDTSAIFLMGNILLDVPTTILNGRVTPYVGGGIGAAFVDNSIRYGPGVNISDSDTAFAYQVIAGADFGVSQNLSVFVDGRYYQAIGVDSVRRNPVGVSTGTVEDDLDGFSVLAGVRYTF